jgi:hypothetical protein
VTEPVILQGLGRSGTSWLSKIFDHHPMVFSIHEPDSAVRRGSIGLGPSDPAEARAYVRAILDCRTLRAMRKRPLLPKAYRSRPAHEARKSLIYGLSLLHEAGPTGRALARRIRVPDLADLSEARVVAKRVAGAYGLEPLVEHNPEIRFIHLVRHPCGNIDSNLRGQKLGKMNRHYLPPRELLKGRLDFDKPHDALTEADFDEIDILALRWSVANEIGLALSERFENVRLVLYEDLCADPIGVSRSLFDWVGLDWREPCERFLRRSLEREDAEGGYHALTRNPLQAANRWRATMDPRDAARIRAICARSGAARLYPDLLEPEDAPPEDAPLEDAPSAASAAGELDEGLGRVGASARGEQG